MTYSQSQSYASKPSIEMAFKARMKIQATILSTLIRGGDINFISISSVNLGTIVLCLWRAQVVREILWHTSNEGIMYYTGTVNAQFAAITAVVVTRLALNIRKFDSIRMYAHQSTTPNLACFWIYVKRQNTLAKVMIILQKYPQQRNNGPAGQDHQSRTPVGFRSFMTFDDFDVELLEFGEEYEGDEYAMEEEHLRTVHHTHEIP
ncbi:hypothetical protein M422DRAFT_240949 [Sphaerobolus stellatus SS14]|nr:hypothetical protein M422DRAFT_240949 [Sphaerobolus stellatus SS14]